MRRRLRRRPRAPTVIGPLEQICGASILMAGAGDLDHRPEVVVWLTVSSASAIIGSTLSAGSGNETKRTRAAPRIPRTCTCQRRSYPVVT